MTKRQITVVIGILSFVGAVVIGNILSKGKGEQKVNASSPSIINVPVINSSSRDITANITFTGNVIPEDKIDIYAEVSGILLYAPKEFKTGVQFKKGETLVKIDDAEFAQSLRSQRSRFASSLSQVIADISVDYPNEVEEWSAYLNAYDAMKPIEKLPQVSNDKLKLFITGRGIYSDYFAIKQSEERLLKYTIKAPFTGTVTRSNIDRGTLVRANQMLGEYIKSGVYEIEASVPVNEVSYINVGDKVNLEFSDDIKSNLTATVKRINSSIDSATQTVLVYLSVKSDNLLTGQFVKGNIAGKKFENAMIISRDILVRDNMIFVIKDSVATLQEIDVLARLGDDIIISSIGDDLEIINEFRNPVFEGTKVAGLRK